MALIPEAAIRTLRTLKAQDYSDTFQRLERTETTSAYNHGKPSFPTEGVAYACRFVPSPLPDLLPGADVEMVDGELFYSREVELSPHDRVLITHLHGDRVEALTYNIVKGPVLGSLGNTAALRLVQE